MSKGIRIPSTDVTIVTENGDLFRITAWQHGLGTVDIVFFGSHTIAVTKESLREAAKKIYEMCLEKEN